MSNDTWKMKKIRITDLLYPHWLTLIFAFVAVLGESITDLLEPWPLKIVFDYVFGSKRMPDWLSGLVAFLGTDKLSILNFAVLSVIAIAITARTAKFRMDNLSVPRNATSPLSQSGMRFD